MGLGRHRFAGTTDPAWRFLGGRAPSINFARRIRYGAGYVAKHPEPPANATRCQWVGEIPEFKPYHDKEWGWPVVDDTRLFEKMTLESFQSGLSWRTIFNKRPAFRRAFSEFQPDRVAKFGKRDVTRLLKDAGIVRHRGKIESAINNAGVVLEIQERFGSLAAFVWQYEPTAESRPTTLTWNEVKTMATSPESKALSKDLKKLGWKFFGPTTAYAFMQSMGIVNDHTSDCWCREPVERARNSFQRPATT